MATKRVKVPQKDGEITMLHSDAGLFLTKTYPVTHGAVEVDEQHVPFFLTSVAGSELAEAPEAESDKTKK